MPAISVPRIWLPDPATVGAEGTVATINQAGDLVSLICEVPQTGTVTGMHFTVRTITTGCTIVGRLETVSSGAIPSNTLYNANATGTVAVSAGTTTYAITFTGSFTATQGDIVAVTLRISSGTPSNLQIATFLSMLNATTTPVGYKIQSGVTTAGSNQLPVCSLTYNSGEVPIVGVTPFGAFSTPAISTGTSPNEIGMKITSMPFSARAVGFMMRSTAFTAAQLFEICLYDSNTNLLASHTIPSINAVNSSNLVYLGTFDSPATLLKNRTYRLTVLPTTSNSWSVFQGLNTLLATPEQLGSYGKTSRTGSGAWTDDATTFYPLCLALDTIYQGGGSYFG